MSDLELQGTTDAAVDFRELSVGMEEALAQLPGAVVGHDSEVEFPVKHTWGDGCYVREWRSAPDAVVVSKIHKVAHPYFVLEGEVSVVTEEGLVRIQAPHYGITPAGCKRILYTHTDVVWVTVHVTHETDLDKIEDEIIAKDFSDVALTAREIEQIAEAAG